MAGLAGRFEAKVDRSGDHHLWTGSKKPDGTGKLKVDGTTVTARRVAWELVNGPVPAGGEVKACPAAKACVRVEHLSLARTNGRRRAVTRRGARSAGSKRLVRPGVWKLTVSVGADATACNGE